MNNMKKIIGILMVLFLVPAALAAEPLAKLGSYDWKDAKDTAMIKDTQEEAITQQINYGQDYDGQQQDMCLCECPTPPQPIVPQIDVIFLIDSTGSMSDEIRTIKTHIINIVNDVRNGNPGPDLRIGVVAYRDYQPEDREYVSRKFDLIRDIDKQLENLKDIEANGGGDHPEAVETGLHVAINKMNWNMNAKKLVFLIGDAAPHGYGAGDRSFPQGSPEGYNYKQLISDARQKGVTIFTVSCSGMDPAGDRIWKDIASMTGGSYDKLSYQRRVVEDYYEEQGISEEWIPEAKESDDYDAATGTILTNTLGDMAKSTIMAEAASMGVQYDEYDEPTSPDPSVEEPAEDTANGSWLDAGDITGNTVPDPAEKVSGQAGVFSRMLSRIAFWT